LLNAGNDLRLALGWQHVGHGNVKILADDSAVDLLVDSDTDSALVYVENDSGAAVIVLVRHALVDGRVHLDINIVASLECAQVGGSRASSGGVERLLEQGASVRSVTKRVRHAINICINI